MTSIASPYHHPLTPLSSKKRVFAEANTDSIRQPKKRLQQVNLPSKFSGTAVKSSMPVPKPATQLTGLEGHLKLDQDFVESSKATEDDETKRSVQISSDSSYEALLAERRHLVSDDLLHNSLN